jgi:hypothetical protein
MRHPMGLSGLMAVVSLISCMGCPTPTPVDDSEEAPPDEPVATLTAYINITSGCQQPTVDFIKALEREHGDKLAVEFVDFGDADKGFKAWKEAGLSCMALQINGNSTVTWGEGEDRRTVTFEYPVDFCWTHEALAEAVQAAIEGRLQPGSPEEAEGPRILEVKVAGRSVKVGETGPETGQLTVDDAVIVEITQGQGEMDPAQRVTAAAEALNRELERPFKPSTLRVEQMDEGWAVMAGDETLLIATDADAEATQAAPKKLAETWLTKIRQALSQAATTVSEQADT